MPIRSFAVNLALLAPLGLTLLSIAGCSGTGATDGSGADGVSFGSATPAAVLQNMVDVYRDAKSYSGKATVTLSFRERGREQRETASQEVAYVSPNKLALRINQDDFRLSVVCDGSQLVAQIEEELTENMGGQVVVRPAPERLKMIDLVSDDVIKSRMTGALVPPMQSELLLSENALAKLIDKSVGKLLLADDSIDGRLCYRVQVDAVVGDPKEGFLVFWIDKESYLLRRLEHPTKAISDRIGKPSDQVKLEVEYHDISIDTELANDIFQLAVPDGATTVGFFVPAPPKEPLEKELYGSRPENLSFLKADKSRLDQAALDGKVAVFVWFSDEPGSRATLEQLSEIRRGYANNDKVEFYGVTAEEIAAAAALVKSWKVEVPVVADDQLHGKDTFRIEGWPTLIALGAEGTVEYAELGDNPQLAGRLPVIIERLLNGDDVAAAVTDRIDAMQAAYLERLKTAQEAMPANLISLEREALKPPKQGRRLKLTKLWSPQGLVAPGNITVVEGGDSPQIFVFDGWRTIVELDSKGETVARHTLPLPEKEVVSYLRTAVDGAGKRWFAASARMGRQVHVFDENWELKSSYPPADVEHEGLSDVQLGDLDGDGTPEMVVGFWGLVGVHGVSLEGETLWRNRKFSSVLSIALTEKNDFDWRKALVTGFEGGILRLNQFGRNDDPFVVGNPMGNFAMHYLYAARFTGGHTPFCGISTDGQGNPTAVGLAVGAEDLLEPIWDYRLPAGVMPNQIEAVTSGKLLDGAGGQWIFAGPEGTLHVIGHDGGFHDSMALGRYLTGVAATRIEERPVLLLATERDDEIEMAAWQVERVGE